MKVGIDIIEIERINENESFLNKILTKNELIYINKFSEKRERIAGHFCAKEAIFKALDMTNFSYQDIEISHSPSGRPIANFYGKIKEHFIKNYKDIDISISHSRTVATAICIVNEKSKIIPL